ncbi:serine hydrolase [Nocardioides sp. SYSU D00038]|uniref:serine hydrolase domain-containing protein n=1 Tax=Nocardioides sp. SYSU D00038 TaxID=2812554 RepID=UPI0019671A46|nr:serine hydrolase domain-containing protein [Nocardioides sp. SYSU D00038]
MTLSRAAQVVDDHAPDRPLVVAVRAGGASRTWVRGDLPDGAASVFEIGSVTKTWTATLLALLATEGVVGLDDPVAAHLPVAPPVVGRPITLTDLATHHSGLPRLPAGLGRGSVDRREPYAALDDDAVLRAIPATAPTRPPGERFLYSNWGAGLLGRALAHAAGTSYADLVATRITGPLGLDDAWVDLPPAAEHRLAPGHGWWGRPAGRWHLAGLAAAGGVCATATDLLDFLAIHDPAATGPLADAARETARQRHDLGRAGGVGLGWLVTRGDEGPATFRVPHDVLWHNGGTGGYRSFAAVVPATGDAVVLSARARSVDGLGWRLVRSLA